MAKYILTISTKDLKPLNKFYKFICKNYDVMELETMDFISFNYPILCISDNEEKVEALINALVKEGFEVSR